MAEGNDRLKYIRIYNWGRSLIVSGVLKTGDRFLSEHVLEKKFGYSRQTVRAALELLEREGLVQRVRGSGTYVAYENGDSVAEEPHIGLILSYFADYLFPEVYAGIESVMKERGIKIDVAVTKNRLNDEALYLESFLRAGVKGLIIEGTRSSFPNPHLRLYEELRRRNVPTLFIHNHYSNIAFDSVEMEDAKCSYMLTAELIRCGHRKIGGVFKYDDRQGIERYHGFLDCLADHGLTLDDDAVRWYSTKDMEYKFSKKSLQNLFRRSRDCTAMVLYNDEVAVKYMEFVRERGIRVPEDVSIVSFDDARLLSENDIRLLSAIHPKFELGRLTARNLLRMMGDKDWQSRSYSYRFPVLLNRGDSVAVRGGQG